MKYSGLVCSLVFATTVSAVDPPAASTLVVDESFDRAMLGKEWNTTTGEWKIVDGVLHAREVPSEKHSAATRRIVETQDAVYEVRFRFVNGGKLLHFGFDPVRGELKKKGHLFSVIVAPDSWKILKHVDKHRPKEDPSEILAEQKTPFKRGCWYTMRVTTEGVNVVAKIEHKDVLRASHPTFTVKKPTLVFRCLGDGVELDRIRVWIRKSADGR